MKKILDLVVFFYRRQKLEPRAVEGTGSLALGGTIPHIKVVDVRVGNFPLNDGQSRSEKDLGYVLRGTPKL